MEVSQGNPLPLETAGDRFSQEELRNYMPITPIICVVHVPSGRAHDSRRCLLRVSCQLRFKAGFEHRHNASIADSMIQRRRSDDTPIRRVNTTLAIM